MLYVVEMLGTTYLHNFLVVKFNWLLGKKTPLTIESRWSETWLKFILSFKVGSMLI